MATPIRTLLDSLPRARRPVEPGPAPAGMRWVWLPSAMQWQLDVA